MLLAPDPRVVATFSAQVYQVERRRLFRQRMVIGTVLAMVLVPLFAILDYVVYPPQFGMLLTARLASFGATGAILALLYTRVGTRCAPWLGIALGVETGLAITGVPVYVTGIENTPHYVSASLLLLSVAALLPWMAMEVVILSAAVASVFVSATLLHGSLPSAVVFVMQVSTIAVTGGLSGLIASLSEGGRAREFRARRALRAIAHEKTRLAGDLQHKSAAVERLNVEMEDILYVSSHDLRAPLINIQGFTNELTIGLAALAPYISTAPEAVAIRADLDDSLSFMTSATQRMDALVAGLLDVCRIATRTSPTEDVPLHSVIERVIDSFRYQLDHHRINARVGMLPTVRGDPLRLNQVFSNLVDNAIKYMGDSPRREIEIDVRNGDGARVFYVHDTGPGIPSGCQEAVFRIFRRLDNDVPGEGLGLTAVRKIIEKHGGHIWVESSPGDGCTFCFTLWERQPPSWRP